MYLVEWVNHRGNLTVVGLSRTIVGAKELAVNFRQTLTTDNTRQPIIISVIHVDRVGVMPCGWLDASGNWTSGFYVKEEGIP